MTIPTLASTNNLDIPENQNLFTLNISDDAKSEDELSENSFSSTPAVGFMYI